MQLGVPTQRLDVAAPTQNLSGAGLLRKSRTNDRRKCAYSNVGTRVPTSPQKGLTMTATLTPKLQTLVDKIVALRTLTKQSGFRTEKSQRDLLMHLTPDELALVAEALLTK